MPLNADNASATVAAYREIKRRIVDLQYGVGEKLSEARLVTELGFGRSPIRTALARLKVEGWIAVSPQSGTYVKALTNRDIEQVTELRILLEKHTADIAARRISAVALKSLRDSFRASEPAVLAGDVDSFINLDATLHNAIYRAADNDLITEILLNLRDKVQWIRRACVVASGDRLQESYLELKQILAALEAGDGEAAAEALRLHIHNAAAFCRAIEHEPKDRRRVVGDGLHEPTVHGASDRTEVARTVGERTDAATRR